MLIKFFFLFFYAFFILPYFYSPSLVAHYLEKIWFWAFLLMPLFCLWSILDCFFNTMPFFYFFSRPRDIQWSRVNDTLPERAEKTSNILHMSRLSQSHNGTYLCQAHNNYGRAADHYTLLVYGKKSTPELPNPNPLPLQTTQTRSYFCHRGVQLIKILLWFWYWPPTIMKKKKTRIKKA